MSATLTVDPKKYARLANRIVVKAIENEEEYDRMTAEVERLMDKGEDQLSAEESALLETMAILIQSYDDSHAALAEIPPNEMLTFLMESSGLAVKDLLPVFGTRGRVSEVLNGRRSISKEQAKRIYNKRSSVREIVPVTKGEGDLEMRYFNYRELNIKNKIDLITFLIGIPAFVYLIYANFLSKQEPLIDRAAIVAFALVIVFLKHPFSEKNAVLRWVVDGLHIALALFCYGHLLLTGGDLVLYRLGGELTSTDLFIYLPGTYLCIEATRRATGLPLAIISWCLIAYAHFGHYVPGFFSHAYLDFGRIAEAVFLNVDGVFGATTHTMITMIWFFIMFGVFLEATGAGTAFIDFAYSLTGRRRGGSGLANIFANYLYGFVSGSGVAGVVTLGPFLMPLMKGQGFKPIFTGGLTAAAAMGSQITPPVLGSAAFLISGLTGITYLAICKATVTTAIFYFLSLGLCVYFEAGRLGVLGLPAEQVPRPNRDIMIKALVPLSSIAIMVVILVVGLTPRIAGSGAALWIFAMAFLYRKRGMAMNPAAFLRCLSESFTSGASLAAILATAGACVAVVNTTGIGMKFSALIVSLGQSHLVLALLLVMGASLLLGMGLPTPACYIILAILAGPALVKLGAGVLEAHLLIFYFGVFAGLTPPVGIAFMTAAAMLKAPAFRVGISSVRIALVGLILPFVWIYYPALILNSRSIFDIAWVFFTTAIGIVGLCMVNIGYSINKPLRIWERVLFFLISIPLIFTNDITLIPLLMAFGLLFYVHHYGFTLEPAHRVFRKKAFPMDAQNSE
jgi:TRAP transporter 4TM/12TM fusion protein